MSDNEVIEYKSPGHPDTLTDLVVEKCATALDHYYQKRYGRVLHYNVDKALFLAGDVVVYYGGGKVVKNPTFILGGQASEIDEDVKHLLTTTIKGTVAHYLPNLGRKFYVEIRTNNVAKNLKDIADSHGALANDTSFGVGYYPFSKNEQTVFTIIDELNKMIAGNKIPIGELYKIMLTPKTISISAPLYATQVINQEKYTYYKYTIEYRLSQLLNLLSYDIVMFNPDFESGHPYLTLCGSSIECGDDGQVGRGNRYNGLITPNRPMTIEAFHGKNNKNHVGKIYQKWAMEKAKALYEKTGKYTEVTLVSKIGKPINEYEMYVNQKEPM